MEFGARIGKRVTKDAVLPADYGKPQVVKRGLLLLSLAEQGRHQIPSHSTSELGELDGALPNPRKSRNLVHGQARTKQGPSKNSKKKPPRTTRAANHKALRTSTASEAADYFL